MSHFLKMTVDLTDPESIVNSLTRMGVDRSAITVHQKPTTLVGWSGQTRQANIIVRKQWLQENAKKVGMNGYTCYADLGFKENEDGTFEAYVDDHNFSVEWVNKMATYHHVEKAKAELENRKIKYTETIEDGKPVITANLPFRKLNSGHQQTLGFSG